MFTNQKKILLLIAFMMPDILLSQESSLLNSYALKLTFHTQTRCSDGNTISPYSPYTNTYRIFAETRAEAVEKAKVGKYSIPHPCNGVYQKLNPDRVVIIGGPQDSVESLVDDKEEYIEITCKENLALEERFIYYQKLFMRFSLKMREDSKAEWDERLACFERVLGELEKVPSYWLNDLYKLNEYLQTQSIRAESEKGWHVFIRLAYLGEYPSYKAFKLYYQKGVRFTKDDLQRERQSPIGLALYWQKYEFVNLMLKDDELNIKITLDDLNKMSKNIEISRGNMDTLSLYSVLIKHCDKQSAINATSLRQTLEKHFSNNKNALLKEKISQLIQNSNCK